MTAHNLTLAAYLIAALLFVLSLAGLARHETARSGVLAGCAGMAGALRVTVVTVAGSATVPGLAALAAALVIGAVIGLWRARVIEMTGMPELIALMHSFVGLTAVLVGWNGLQQQADGALTGVHHAEVGIGVVIVAVTISGSSVAYLKLSAKIRSRPLQLPGKNTLNLLVLGTVVALAVAFAITPSPWLLGILTALAVLLGVHLVASIGGNDIPVVVSMLNSYSGWAAAASGILLDNDLLIITGALVGLSGVYLSYVMCTAMNRSFVSVIAGGFGAPAAAASAEVTGEHREIDAVGVAELLAEARSVVITPGYGMAVAQAQYPIAALTRLLRDRGVEVRFGVHPVAGRLPGHMNVLLAEAQVPYDIVLEMDEINDALAETDVVLVVGAYDTVNPAAAEHPGSPLAGMPVLRVWEAANVVVFKRSMAAGYAGIQNPLFFRENSRMLFGDARDRVEEILAALKRVQAEAVSVA